MDRSVAVLIGFRAEFVNDLRGLLAGDGVDVETWASAEVAQSTAFRVRLRTTAPCALACSLVYPYSELLAGLLGARKRAALTAPLILCCGAPAAVSRLIGDAADIRVMGPPYELEALRDLIRQAAARRVGESP